MKRLLGIPVVVALQFCWRSIHLGGFVVGIKLMEDHVIGALTDLEANILKRYQLPLRNRSSAHAIDVLVELVEKLLILGIVPRSKLIGVGVGLAGIVNSNEGILRLSPYFGWRDLAVRDRLQKRIDSPVCIDNDVNTFTLAERWYGTGQGVDNFLTVTVGRGVGLGDGIKWPVLSWRAWRSG